ncbi:MAG: hypothetical protein BroJett014_11230 [Planctomycetota bacterium]|nr:hypothetical protein [Planctomycetota bacterium]GIK52150.1 MAG: hypothetical protein BroJett014_11230 [Planctomycetota bacterium]
MTEEHHDELGENLDSLASLVDSVPVKGSLELDYLDGHYAVCFQPCRRVGYAFRLSHLPPGNYGVSVDSGLPAAQRRVVLFHEMAELFFYYTKGVRPQERAHALAVEQHLKYAAQRKITPPE